MDLLLFRLDLKEFVLEFLCADYLCLSRIVGNRYRYCIIFYLKNVIRDM